MRRFSIRPTGDPYNRTGWDVFEEDENKVTWFRGDLSPHQGRDRTVAMLRRTFPGCKVRVER